MVCDIRDSNQHPIIIIAHYLCGEKTPQTAKETAENAFAATRRCKMKKESRTNFWYWPEANNLMMVVRGGGDKDIN